MMFCPICGRENPDGAAFCRACGTALGAPTPSQPSPQPAPTPAPRRRKWLLPVLLAALAVVAAAAVLLILRPWAKLPVASEEQLYQAMVTESLSLAGQVRTGCRQENVELYTSASELQAMCEGYSRAMNLAPEYAEIYRIDLAALPPDEFPPRLLATHRPGELLTTAFLGSYGVTALAAGSVGRQTSSLPAPEGLEGDWLVCLYYRYTDSNCTLLTSLHVTENGTVLLAAQPSPVDAQAVAELAGESGGGLTLAAHYDAFEVWKGFAGYRATPGKVLTVGSYQDAAGELAAELAKVCANRDILGELLPVDCIEYARQWRALIGTPDAVIRWDVSDDTLSMLHDAYQTDATPAALWNGLTSTLVGYQALAAQGALAFSTSYRGDAPGQMLLLVYGRGESRTTCAVTFLPNESGCIDVSVTPLPYTGNEVAARYLGEESSIDWDSLDGSGVPEEPMRWLLEQGEIVS